MLKITFYSNGLTTAYEGGKQVPELQKGWLLLYCTFLESKGIDPESVQFVMPHSEPVIVQKVEGGYNWTY